ncbi:hypothetical protein BGW36DRAFT_435749 [Talaromyces proteolyticus]|uniref:SRR1-like domain-containing protein n=1 Tax=Talaromyces proteolyticus TaxID=1131652 RepID=A0AAD4Q6L3_9EURO|nr:uncharacterized protein BGW36DRAFT_435749 [Talaromyces proteolyticus]KAH8705763.1 hypothetical protein BGW36DRAFT_435749 [Talaromyces proteolyticus]
MKFNLTTTELSQTPHIHYVSFQNLTLPNRLPRNHDLLYCNVRIYHRRVLRSITRKEFPANNQIRSLSDSREIFANNSQTWYSSSQCEQLKSILLSITTPANIRKIIAFGLGTIAARWPPCSSTGSSYQHALILTLQDIFHKKQQKQQGAHLSTIISCYSQDPAYTYTDKILLSESGITVLDDPDGFLEIDDSTLVVSCAPNAPVKEIVSDIACPAIMIWNRVKDEDHIISRTVDLIYLFRADPDSPRLRKMIMNMYDIIEFPKDMTNFKDIVIYTRKMDVQSLDTSFYGIHEAFSRNTAVPARRQSQGAVYHWHESCCRHPDISVVDGVPYCSYCSAVPSLDDNGEIPAFHFRMISSNSRAKKNLAWPSIVDYSHADYLLDDHGYYSKISEEALDKPRTKTLHNTPMGNLILPDIQPLNDIRLLRLKRDSSQSPIHVEFIGACLEVNFLPSYDTVSYTLNNDPQDSTIDPSWALLGCYVCRTKLPKGSYAARNAKTDQLLWVYSLCIEQNDAKEKTQQTILANKIYSEASKVIAYDHLWSTVNLMVNGIIHTYLSKSYGPPWLLKDEPWYGLTSQGLSSFT